MIKENNAWKTRQDEITNKDVSYNTDLETENKELKPIIISSKPKLTRPKRSTHSK